MGDGGWGERRVEGVGGGMGGEAGGRGGGGVPKHPCFSKYQVYNVYFWFI